MLTLQRLEVKGFGLYAERSVLEIPESGVTVVYGNNGRGKTTLMKAFRLALLGTPLGGQTTTSNERIDRAWVLDSCNRDLRHAGEYGFEVRLGVRHDDVEWEIVRKASPRRPQSQPDSDADFNLDVSLRRNDYVPGPDERQDLLRSMMPAEIARFFLFDGELLNQYAELLDNDSEMGRRISDSIEQILGVPVLKNARNHLNSLRQKLSRDAATEASKDQETRALGNSITATLAQRQAQQDELARAEKDLNELQVQRTELEAEMRKQEMYAAAVERLDRAHVDLKEARTAHQRKVNDLQYEMTNAWRTVVGEKVAEAKAESQQAMINAIDGLVDQLRARAARDHHCEVCDQDLSKDQAHQITMALRHEEETFLTNATARSAVARAADLDRFASSDVRHSVETIWKDISDARMKEVEALGMIKDAQDTLAGRDQRHIRSVQDSYAKVVAKIETTQHGIQKTEDHIDSLDKDIARLEKNLEKKGTVAFAEKKRQKDVASDAHAVFADAVDRYKTALRTKVELSATDLFLRMTTGKSDYAKLSINDHYGLAIVHNDGQTESGRSAGQEQVVALALMGALQANAPLRGPIVMDTPFGRLDDHHTQNVVTTLPTMSNQVVLLVQEGEIDRATIRAHLGRHLVKEYELTGDSFRQTKIVEVRSER